MHGLRLESLNFFQAKYPPESAIMAAYLSRTKATCIHLPKSMQWANFYVVHMHTHTLNEMEDNVENLKLTLCLYVRFVWCGFLEPS